MNEKVKQAKELTPKRDYLLVLLETFHKRLEKARYGRGRK